jgi:purine-cytosine permease-like protein
MFLSANNRIGQSNGLRPLNRFGPIRWRAVMRIKRDYQSWVANETLEDYALRYAASSYRRWSPSTLANTAIGGISFLALEAIGASITLSFGFHNAFPAILVVCALIFLVSVPIAYYSSEANVDIDLLTRGAGFGYVGSTITSLIYASFTFIFFALEAAILAQALELAAGINIVIGYLLSSLLIIPLVFFGVTLINKLQMWTQPLWAILLVMPFIFVLYQDPDVLHRWAAFPGLGAAAAARSGGIDVLLFGTAAGVLFSLMGQIGEQVDYLRFLPDRISDNRLAWWTAMLMAGPGWIVVGGLKLLAGSLLAVLALEDGVPAADAVVPVHLYVTAYQHVFDSHTLALAVATVFVVISQVKINVTNAYAGSLAWSNVFARLTHYHPGRVVWLVFNVMIALLLTLLGIFKTLETVLSVYSNLVIAWLGALVADLVVLKPLGISPRHIEFKRAHLYPVNPVGCGAMLIASVVSTCAFAGLFGDYARAYSAFLALLLAFASAIAIAYATGGRYYIARADVKYADVPRNELVRCCICERDYEAADMAWCPFNQGSICSLCCGLDNHCRDSCKEPNAASSTVATDTPGPSTLAPHFGRRIGRFLGLFLIAATATGAVLQLY